VRASEQTSKLARSRLVSFATSSAVLLSYRLLRRDSANSRRSTGFNQFTRAILRPDGQRYSTSVRPLSTTSTSSRGLDTRPITKTSLRPPMRAGGYSGPEEGSTMVDVERFLAEDLQYEQESFDAVLMWDVCDYLPEPLVKPIVERIYRITKRAVRCWRSFMRVKRAPKHHTTAITLKTKIRWSCNGDRTSNCSALPKSTRGKPLPRLQLDQVFSRKRKHTRSSAAAIKLSDTARRAGSCGLEFFF